VCCVVDGMMVWFVGVMVVVEVGGVVWVGDVIEV